MQTEYIRLYEKNIYYKTGFTRDHFLKLITEKIIPLHFHQNEYYISRKELSIVKNFELDLRKNWKTINQFFLENIHTQKSFKNPDEIIHNLAAFCEFKTKPQLINYRSSTYMSKILIKDIENHLLTKSEVKNNLGLNEVHYRELLKKFSIEEFIFTKRTVYILKKDYQKLSSYKKKKSIDYPESNWVPATELIKINKYQKFGIKVETFLKQINNMNIRIKKINDYPTLVDLNNLDAVCRELNYLSNNYYTAREFHSLLGLQKLNINKLTTKRAKRLIVFLSEIGIDYKTTEYSFNYNQLYINKTQLNKFIDTHQTVSHIINQFRLTEYEFKEHIEGKLTAYVYTSHYTFYNSKDIDKTVKNNQCLNFKRSQFYDRSEVSKILEINNHAINKMVKDKKLDAFFKRGKTYYKKENIYILKDRKAYVQNNFVPAKRLFQFQYNERRDGRLSNIKGSIRASGIDRYCFKEEFIGLLIPLEFYKNFKSKYEFKLKTKKIKNSIDYNNSFDAFNQLISLHNIEFTNASKETEELWLSFVKNRLEKCQGRSLLSLRNTIRDYVTTTKILSNFCSRKNIFEISTNEINLSLLNVENIDPTKLHITIFLKEIFLLLKENNREVKFNLDHLTNIYKNNRPKLKALKDKSYSPKIFLELIEYSKLKEHKNHAIEDAIKVVKASDGKKGFDYSYSWFYVLLHLSIAWRNSDIISLKMIDIDCLNITSLQELKDRNLTVKEVNYIINELITNENYVSKTGVKNNFYINDELKEPMANAYVICHLLNMKIYPFRDNIINFSNKPNAFLVTQHHFFRKFKYDIKFENRKMNRTLITSIQKMLQEKGEGTKGLQISKLLRAHTNIDTTKIYVDLNSEDMNKLSIHLFDRGSFGFIPKILSEIVFGKAKNFQLATKNIHKINSIFKDIYNIEVSAGFLNTLNNEENDVIDMLLNEGIKNCQETLDKINLNMLPGKVENFQCLLANTGCVKPERDCKHCIYSIPNKYAIDSIIDSLIEHVDEITQHFDSLTNTEKIKKANIIFKELRLLNQAFDYFGQSEVLSLFKNKSRDYVSILSSLDYFNNSNNLLELVNAENFT